MAWHYILIQTLYSILIRSDFVSFYVCTTKANETPVGAYVVSSLAVVKLNCKPIYELSLPSSVQRSLIRGQQNASCIQTPGFDLQTT